MSVVMIRVDNRLIHGQVVEGWLPYLKVGVVVVADAEAARSPLARAAMALALPPELLLIVGAPDQIDWAQLEASDERALVLVREVASIPAIAPYLPLASGQLPLKVGMVQDRADRHPVAPGVHLCEAERAALVALCQDGAQVHIQPLPEHPALAPGPCEAGQR